MTDNYNHSSQPYQETLEGLGAVFSRNLQLGELINPATAGSAAIPHPSRNDTQFSQYPRTHAAPAPSLAVPMTPPRSAGMAPPVPHQLQPSPFQHTPDLSPPSPSSAETSPRRHAQDSMPPVIPLVLSPNGPVSPNRQVPTSPGYRPARSDTWNSTGAATAVQQVSDERGAVVNRVVKKGVEDFEFREELGTGSYSTVVAAQDKQTLRQYAIKILDKAHIIKEDKVKYVEIEKNSLNRLGDHPGIIHLYFTFQDRASLFFVLDYAPNGELLQLIKRMGSIDEAGARYYSSQLIDAVDFMHSKGIVHRDLKPENILLDYKMRIKITDFGTAKILEKNEQGEYPADVRANSFVGTAEYVSPELLTQKYQGKSADIWAIGCVLYQMIAGTPPFQGSTQYLTFQRIVRFQYNIPPGFPYLVRDLLKKIFVSPRRRLTIPEIKEHAFYQDQDWSLKALWNTAPPRLVRYKPSASSLNAGGANASPRQVSNPAQGAQSPAQVQAVRSQQQPQPQAQQQVQQRASPNVNQVPRQSGVPAGGWSAGNTPRPHSSTAVAQQPNRTSGQKTSASAAAAALNKSAPVRKTTPPSHLQYSANYQQGQERINAIKRAVREQRSAAAAAGGAAAVSTKGPGPPKPTQAPAPQVSYARQVQQQLKQMETQPQQQPKPSRPVIQVPQRVNTPLSRGSPTDAPSPQGLSSPSRPAPLPSLPLTPLEGEWANVLVSRDERVLKLGRAYVNIGAVGEPDPEEDDGGRFSRLFNARKKTRTVIVTTFGRLLIMGDDRKIRAEIPLGVPQVLIREVLRKNGTLSVVIDTYNRSIIIDHPEEINAWSDNIELSKRYLAQANQEAERNAHSAAAAAAMAVAGGKR